MSVINDHAPILRTERTNVTVPAASSGAVLAVEQIAAFAGNIPGHAPRDPVTAPRIDTLPVCVAALKASWRTMLVGPS